MNERKKSYNDYFNPSVSDAEQDALALSSAISSFMHTCTRLKPVDFISLNHLLKILKKSNNNLPRKVLRGIGNKFHNISQNYQR